MHKDLSYCVKDCDNMECKHNKKHLQNKFVNGKKVVTAVNFSEFHMCVREGE